MDSLFLKYKANGQEKVLELGRKFKVELPLNIIFESDYGRGTGVVVPKSNIRKDFLAWLDGEG